MILKTGKKLIFMFPGDMKIILNRVETLRIGQSNITSTLQRQPNEFNEVKGIEECDSTQETTIHEPIKDCKNKCKKKNEPSRYSKKIKNKRFFL